jgi:hypothetical protein
VLRVERKHQATSEMEHHDRTGCVGFVADEFRGGHASCLEAEAVAVEGERAVEIEARNAEGLWTP